MAIPRKLRRRTSWTIGVVLILLGASFVGQAIGQRVAVSDVTPRPVTPRGDLSADEKNTIDLFQKARASVVYINTRQRVLDPWTRNMFSIPTGTGSGFVWDGRGHIVTNFHVVAGASEARVRLNDGRDSPATLVGASPDHDLAVLRLAVSTSPSPVAIGTSQDLRIGQKVFAIGNRI
jgi:S1-C subfamily serine protease